MELAVSSSNGKLLSSSSNIRWRSSRSGPSEDGASELGGVLLSPSRFANRSSADGVSAATEGGRAAADAVVLCWSDGKRERTERQKARCRRHTKGYSHNSISANHRERLSLHTHTHPHTSRCRMIHVCAVCRARGLCVSFTVCVCVSLSRTRPTVAREACLRVGGEC